MSYAMQSQSYSMISTLWHKMSLSLPKFLNFPFTLILSFLPPSEDYSYLPQRKTQIETFSTHFHTFPFNFTTLSLFRIFLCPLILFIQDLFLNPKQRLYESCTACSSVRKPLPNAKITGDKLNKLFSKILHYIE